MPFLLAVLAALFAVSAVAALATLDARNHAARFTGPVPSLLHPVQPYPPQAGYGRHAVTSPRYDNPVLNPALWDTRHDLAAV